MADVKVISSSIVQPSNIDQMGREKMHLTPSDLNLLILDYPQRGLLFPKPDHETRFISRVKTSLSTALEIYFPLAGRLVKVDNRDDNTVSFYIDYDDCLGARFVHAIADTVSVSDLLQPDGSVPDFFRYFFPMNGVKNIHGITEPLLALQVTEMKDGVFISFAYNHMVADGTSIWNFFHAWSKICSNGSGSDLQPLVRRGWFLDGIDYPIHIPVSETETPPPPSQLSSSVAITEVRVFHFTKKKISDLKAKANCQISSDDLKISSLQAIVAHLWRSIIRHSGLNREGESHCRVAADLRQRLNPPFEKDCFGNVAHLGIATATVEELQAHGLGWTALQISKMVRTLTNDDYKTYIEKWVRNVKILNFGFGSQMVSSDNSVTVTSSPRFQVYDNDFGWGKPIAARAGPSNGRFSGKLVLFRGVEEGSTDVQATLSSHVLTNLLTDVEFLDA